MQQHRPCQDCSSTPLSIPQILETMQNDDYVSFASSCNQQSTIVPLIYAFDRKLDILFVYLAILAGSIEYNNILCNPKVSMQFEKKTIMRRHPTCITFDTITIRGNAQIITDKKEIAYMQNKIRNRSPENTTIYDCLLPIGPLTFVKIVTKDFNGQRNQYKV